MSNKRKITYKCPYCDKRFNKEDLVTHVSDIHDDMIPEGYSAFRLVFDYVNKKPTNYNGKCIICGKETGWDENKGKYNRLCGNPACKKKYVQSFEERMMKSKGVTRISSTAEGQAKMLANRKISGEYKFQDGGIKTYTGTYEKKALEFMDKVMSCKSEDISTPGPILEYDFEGKTHIYISDIYYAPYNLIIEVKDGGNNPNMRSMPEYRAKQIAKEKYIIKYTDYNYLRLTNNDFSQLLTVFMELKMEMSNDTLERVIRINEGVISDRLKYPYKYGEAKKINQELANKINSTNYPWYFINIIELINSGVDINLYGYDEEPVEGVDKPKYKSHHLYNKKVKVFHGRDSLNPSLRKYSKFNKGAAKTKDVVLKEEYIEESNNELLEWMKLKSEIKEDTNMTEAMNALMTGYIPGSVDNPNNVYIVNYMQNNVFSDEDPNEDCIGVSDNPKFTNLIVRDNTGMLKRVDESFLKDKTYKVYILEMSRDEVNERLGKYLGGFVKKNFIYETLTGHKLYTKDQIQFESMFIPTVDYYEFMESFKEICDNYFQLKDKKIINTNESTFVPEEVKVFNKSGLMEIKEVHSMDDYVSAKPSKVLEYLDISIHEGIFQKYKDKKEAKRKEQEEARKQQTYTDIKKAYNDLAKFLEYPFDFGFQSGSRLGNMIEVAKMLNINEAKMMNRMKKIKFKDYTLEKGILLFYAMSSMDKVINEYDPNLNNANLKTKVQKISFNDDNYDFIGQDGKFYSMQTDNKLYIESFYSFYDKSADIDSSDKDVLIKVDQELRYYLLSQPPKGVQKKKLPL